jgi:predicted anti-sigma-YlaC factor YlaD
MGAVMTTVEHLDRCETCRRRTLHRRTVQRDPDGLVVGDVRACVPCANRAAGVDPPTSQVQVMKEARSLKRSLRAQPSKRRGTTLGQG